MLVNMIILVALILASLWTVMTRSLLRSAIGLALTSAILAIMMFKLKSPLSAVFELSVCTGLISVLFVSTISLTHPLTQKEVVQHMKDRLKRFWYLPLLVVIVGISLSLIQVKINLKLPLPETEHDVRFILWHLRHLDLIGQAVLLLSGTFGVVILFKEMFRNE